MSETQEKAIVVEDDGGTITSQVSESSNGEGSPGNCPRHASICPPSEEQCELTHEEIIVSATDCGGYLSSESSAAEIGEGEIGESTSLSEKQVNLLEKTRISKNQKLKERQYDFLKPYFKKMLRRNYRFNWYTTFGAVSSKKPKTIEDFPCECDLEVECKVLEGSEKVCKGEENRSKQESPDKSNILIKSPLQLLDEHNSTCNARRISRYFSCIAEYFVEEDVDPDMFLYIPFSKENCGEDSVDYKYYILQENRKILLLKLKEGLRTKLEFWEEEMTEDDEKSYQYRNEVRTAKHLALRNLLKDLVEPYESSTNREENIHDTNNPNQGPSEKIADEIDQDKCRYQSLKDEHRRLKKRLKRESFERRHEELIDDAKHGGYYVSYEEFLEQQKSNKPSTSKDELEIEKSIEREMEHETDEPENKRKMVDSDQEAEEPESKRKKSDSEEETEEPERK